MLQPLLRPAAAAANDRLRGASPLALPAPPVLDLDFVGRPSLHYPGLPPITFTRSSTAARVNASGQVETVAADVARFDHHPLTGARLGLLVEEARTNLILRSEDFSHAAWTRDNATAAGTAAAPDGADAAQRLSEDTGTGQHRARQTVAASFAAGASLTISCFIKAAGRGFATLQFGAANGFRACFDLAAFTPAPGFAGAAFGTGSFTAAGAQRFPGGWLRCWVTGKEDPAATVGEAYLNIVRAASYTDSYTGDGASGVLAWGYQVEAGPFPSSYVATTGATATRGADAATLDRITPWYNAAEGTLLAEAELLAGASGAAYILASLNDASTNNEIDARIRASNVPAGFVTTGTVAQGNVQAAVTGPTANVSFRLALAFKVDDLAASAFGAAPGTDGSVTLPIVTRLELGAFGGANRMNGRLRRVSCWSTRLANPVVQILSQ